MEMRNMSERQQPDQSADKTDTLNSYFCMQSFVQQNIKIVCLSITVSFVQH